MDNLHQDFVIELDAKENTSTLRLFLMPDPEKTDGVKTVLGLVTHFILYISSDAKILKTNIGQFIPKR